MAARKERNTTSKLSRRDILSTVVIAGGALTAASASIAQAADQAPNPSRGPGVGGTDRYEPGRFLTVWTGLMVDR